MKVSPSPQILLKPHVIETQPSQKVFETISTVQKAEEVNELEDWLDSVI
jgi:hypothetical protein